MTYRERKRLQLGLMCAGGVMTGLQLARPSDMQGWLLLLGMWVAIVWAYHTMPRARAR